MMVGQIIMDVLAFLVPPIVIIISGLLIFGFIGICTCDCHPFTSMWVGESLRRCVVLGVNISILTIVVLWIALCIWRINI